jgi:hypothetical protein
MRMARSGPPRGLVMGADRPPGLRVGKRRKRLFVKTAQGDVLRRHRQQKGPDHCGEALGLVIVKPMTSVLYLFDPNDVDAVCFAYTGHSVRH